MPPKRKGKKKKKKKAVAKAEEVPSEFSGLTIVELKKQFESLTHDLSEKVKERNRVQLERDAIQTFYDITRKELRDLDSLILSKDKEMETMEDNHRVEVRVYIQKVKHLEYEHKNTLKRVRGEGDGSLTEEHDMHLGRELELRKAKKELRLELKERELLSEEEIKNQRQQHEKNLIKLREEFERNLSELESKYEEKVATLRSDLELRRKVEIHEIEERKNLHINDLMNNHEKAFGQIKNYYNDITHDNLDLIKRLKGEVAEMKKKRAMNQKLMNEIASENKRLLEPLNAALDEVDQLKNRLRDSEKDRLSLKNAAARLLLLEEQRKSLQREHALLAERYEALERERTELYRTFESTVVEVQRRAEFKSMVLERRLSSMEAEFQKKQAQVEEILRAHADELDPVAVAEVSRRLDEVLDARNALIKDLQYQVARVTKAHNDAIRVYSSKMETLGIPAEEISFRELETTTTPGPAGLVAAAPV